MCDCEGVVFPGPPRPPGLESGIEVGVSGTGPPAWGVIPPSQSPSRPAAPSPLHPSSGGGSFPLHLPGSHQGGCPCQEHLSQSTISWCGDHERPTGADSGGNGRKGECKQPTLGYRVVNREECGIKKRVLKRALRGFPGGPVVRTPRFHCRGCRFNPWWRN